MTEVVITRTMILILLPIAVVELVLLAVALVDLIRREPGRVNGPKLLWGILIVLFGFIGPIAYFIVGRKG